MEMIAGAGRSTPSPRSHKPGGNGLDLDTSGSDPTSHPSSRGPRAWKQRGEENERERPEPRNPDFATGRGTYGGASEGDREMTIALLVLVVVCYGGILRIARIEGHI